MVKKKVQKKKMPAKLKFNPESTDGYAQLANPFQDYLGRRLRVDSNVLKAKMKIEGNATLNSLIEEGVRQFLGISGEPPTKQMLAFLMEVGVVVSSAPADEVQLIHS